MITTLNGRSINPFSFRAEDISLEELAHALACQNRFFGHARYPISIAQHAVGVSLLVQDDAMQGLHHDDSEALLGDVNKWLKATECFAEYRRIENSIQTEFYKKFGCSTVMTEEVRRADQFAVRCELYFAFGKDFESSYAGYERPTEAELQWFIHRTQFRKMSWIEAETLYLNRHIELSSTIHNVVAT